MRILHVAAALFPSLGGVETHVRELTTELENLGHEVDTFTLTPRQRQAHKLAVWNQVWRARNQFLAADVVQVHDVWWWLLPVLPLVIGKVFVTFHGWEGRYPVRWQAQLHRWVAALFSRGTLHVGDWIREFYWDVPDVVLYGGVRLPHQRPLLSDRKDWAERPVRLVFFGRLSAENEIQMYVELLAEFQKRGVAYSMTWVGDGSDRNTCAQWGEVTGMLLNASEQLATADVVFANSYLAIAEAQSHGALVCALYSNPLKQRYLETFPTAHVLVKSDNVSRAFDELMERLTKSTHGNPLRQQIKHTISALTWSKVAKRYLQLWKSRLSSQF